MLSKTIRSPADEKIPRNSPLGLTLGISFQIVFEIMAARFAAYLATKNGKRFSAFAAITGSGVAVLSTLLPNSLCLNQVQEVVQLYR